MVEIFTGNERSEKLMKLGRRSGKWLKWFPLSMDKYQRYAQRRILIFK